MSMAKTTNTYKKRKSGGASSDDSRSKRAKVSGPLRRSARLGKKTNAEHIAVLIEGNVEVDVNSQKDELDGVHVTDANVKEVIFGAASVEAVPVEDAQTEAAHVDEAYVEERYIDEAQVQAEQVLHRNIKRQVENKPSKNVFRFMALPQELRDLVYDEVWKDTPHIKAPYLDFGAGTTVRYDHLLVENRHLEGLPTWLLTSKQMCEEGLAQFRLKAQWSTCCFDWLQAHDLLSKFGFDAFDSIEDTPMLDLWMALPKDTSKTSPYLHLSMAHDIVFNHGELEQGATCRLDEYFLAGFAQVAQLFNKSPKLKVLRLPVLFSSPKGLRPKMLDLSFLDTLSFPQLQTFEFEIYGETNYVSTAIKQYDFRQVFEAEVHRVGCLLVGGEGQLSVKEENHRVSLERILPVRNEDGNPTYTDVDELHWTFKYTAIGK
jgi:hypothetical protein